MKFFNREWSTCDDARADEIRSAYHQNLDEISSSTDFDPWNFASQVDLRGAEIVRAEFVPEKCQLVVDVELVGLGTTRSLVYALTGSEARPSVRPGMTIWYDEFRIENGDLVHGLLLTDGEEVSIPFLTLSLS